MNTRIADLIAAVPSKRESYHDKMLDCVTEHGQQSRIARVLLRLAHGDDWAPRTATIAVMLGSGHPQSLVDGWVQSYADFLGVSVESLAIVMPLPVVEKTARRSKAPKIKEPFAYRKPDAPFIGTYQLKNGKWATRIKLPNGRGSLYVSGLPQCDTEVEAAVLYDSEARRIGGPRRVLNFRPDTGESFQNPTARAAPAPRFQEAA